MERRERGMGEKKNQVKRNGEEDTKRMELYGTEMECKKEGWKGRKGSESGR